MRLTREYDATRCHFAGKISGGLTFSPQRLERRRRHRPEHADIKVSKRARVSYSRSGQLKRLECPQIGSRQNGIPMLPSSPARRTSSTSLGQSIALPRHTTLTRDHLHARVRLNLRMLLTYLKIRKCQISTSDIRFYRVTAKKNELSKRYTFSSKFLFHYACNNLYNVHLLWYFEN